MVDHSSRIYYSSISAYGHCYSLTNATYGNDRNYPEEEGNLFTAVVEIVASKFALLFSQILIKSHTV